MYEIKAVIGQPLSRQDEAVVVPEGGRSRISNTTVAAKLTRGLRGTGVAAAEPTRSGMLARGDADPKRWWFLKFPSVFRQARRYLGRYAVGVASWINSRCPSKAARRMLRSVSILVSIRCTNNH